MSDDPEGGLGGALFLGVLQGLTEFLPVSSSGHLVLFQQFFEIGTDHVLFDLVLHLGTLVPVLWFYREHVRLVVTDPIRGQGPFREREGVKLLGLLVAASIPTALIGLTFEDLFESLFSNPAALTLTFAITGFILMASGIWDRSAQKVPLTVPLAVVLGIAQGFAITPGISRSGTTIAVALMLGMEREVAARFSFLMSVPAILGAVLLKFKDADFSAIDMAQLAAGGLASLVTGYVALVLLVKLVKSGMFKNFAWYCWGAAIVAGVLAFAA
jgi:undecaprenyl-diphosphatase